MAPPPPPCRRRRRSPPALMDELVEEILLRVPPDEPAHLVRAAAVCRPWRRIVSDRGFRRRYRELHRTPRLIGYFHNLDDNFAMRPTLVPTSPAYAFSRPALAGRHSCAHDCRHGRVLIETFPQSSLVVWDPVTGDQQHLTVPAYQYSYSTAAVLCAVDGCDHLDCHRGPFRVVFVGSYTDDYMGSVAWASTYSSETGAWSASTSVQIDYDQSIGLKPSLFIGDALYFTLQYGVGILKYDLGKHELSEIDTPGISGAIIVKTEDRGLGFVCVLDNNIYLLSQQKGAIGIAGLGWVELKVINLETLLPKVNLSSSLDLVGFAEGTDIVFINMGMGVFALDLKSQKVRRVGEYGPYYAILPYTSTYIPDLPKGRLSLP
ncbi:hypothetical protein ACP70R_015196 [Stipagrostis hirtigluma subsp. patula]